MMPGMAQAVMSLGKCFATGTCTSTSLGDGGSSEGKSHGGSKVPFSPVP